MKKYIIILVVLMIACKTGKDNIIINEDAFESAIPSSEKTNYLPYHLSTIGDPEQNSRLDSMLRKNYSNILFTLKEPVLYNYAGRGEAIRLLWIRPFDKPISIRLNKFGDSVYAVIKKGGVFATNIPIDKLEMDTVYSVNQKIWTELNKRLNNISFSTIPTEDTFTSKDGIQWVLERKSFGEYHFINRFNDTDLKDSNSKSPEINRFAKELVEIGQQKVNMNFSRE